MPTTHFEADATQSARRLKRSMTIVVGRMEPPLVLINIVAGAASQLSFLKIVKNSHRS